MLPKDGCNDVRPIQGFFHVFPKSNIDPERQKPDSFVGALNIAKHEALHVVIKQRLTEADPAENMKGCISK